MLTLSNYDLYCPECQKKADTANPMFIRYSISSLKLPIFLCGKCRTIYIDKPTVRRVISKWRKYGAFTRAMPFKRLYQEFLGELEGLVNTYFVSYLGYRKTRFLKRPQKTNPRTNLYDKKYKSRGN